MALFKRRRFLMKRLHSFFGLCLLFFLMEHLYTNSQAALTEGGKGFIEAVNFLHSLPMLGLIELLTLGLPFLIHIVWGLAYVAHTKLNSCKGVGDKPALSQFKTNKAFTWQRITAILLVIGVVWHVYEMRFNRYPVTSDITGQGYVVHLNEEKLTDEQAFEVITIPHTHLVGNVQTPFGTKTWEKMHPKEEGVYVKTAGFAEAVLLNVKDAFSNVWIACLYTLFVVFATFHAFNGLWTLCVTWGIASSEKGFGYIRSLSVILMLIFTFLGLVAIWGS